MQTSIDGASLTIEELIAVARGRRAVALSPAARAGVERGHQLLVRLAEARGVLYGVNTGVGSLGKQVVPPDRVPAHQADIIRSHAAGVGDPVSAEVTRAVMLLRANTLAKGLSGVRPATLDAVIAMLNAGIHPLVPEQGSVGASGDLAPLSHVGLVLIGEGRAELEGETVDGATALRRAGLEPVILGPKEGLALNNGTQFTTAVGALALHDAERLLDAALGAGALTLEAMDGITDSFDARVHRSRPHPGALAVAGRMRTLLAGSGLVRASMDIRPDEPRGPQDPYSFRAIPAALGTAKDLLDFVRRTIMVEMNSATDDPLFFEEDEPAVLYCCNFHGQPVAAALDVLCLAAATIGNMAERRIAMLTDEHHNRGLPAFLVAPRESTGQTGFMIAHVTAAALASENKKLAHPASVDTIPTCANFEDFVSMGPIAARAAAAIVRNTARIVAIELLVAAQAIDLRGVRHRLGAGTRVFYEAVRARVPMLESERVLTQDIESVTELVRSAMIW